MISVNNLSFKYPSGVEVLNDISFTIPKGAFVALIGQNGAGKTTLLKQFNSLLRPTTGRVLIAGIDTSSATTGKLAQKVGFLFQNPDHQIFMANVEREIGFGPKNLGLSK
ncbi:MAG TPA: energy-coupling factor ABC transporter ATP-binding protein, partial [Firmicutes bacterium]|nr:energy-coupling factor ABC transporter ATP-binding protein [Bacillota bacterium]